MCQWFLCYMYRRIINHWNKILVQLNISLEKGIFFYEENFLVYNRNSCREKCILVNKKILKNILCRGNFLKYRDRVVIQLIEVLGKRYFFLFFILYVFLE